MNIKAGKIKIKRRIERGIEIVEGPFPILVTVNGSAASCRPRNAKLLMKYKHASTISERQEKSEDYITMISERPYLNIKEWSVNDIECDREQLGLNGSPTKVKKIENIVFQAKESRQLTGSDLDINELMNELILNHTIG
jgi:electron transfer flavoprotein beta subunit